MAGGSFRHRHAETGKSEKGSLTGAEFLWRILQYVLPKGFRRARHFGLLPLLLKFDPNRFKPPRKERPPMLCSCCGALMTIVRTRIRPTSSAVVAVVPRIGVAL